MQTIFGALKEFNDDAMLMAKQLGTNSIHFNTPPSAGEKTWEADALQWLADYSARFGLKVGLIENVPIRFYDKVLLGTEGRDEQIDNYINIIIFIVFICLACSSLIGLSFFDTQFEKLLVTRFSTAGYFANSLRYFMMCAPVAPYLTINSSNSFTWLCASGVVYRISSSYGSIFAPHGQHSLVL